MHVIYVHDTVDEAIYGKEDLSILLAQKPIATGYGR